jgi:hypothetical protein
MYRGRTKMQVQDVHESVWSGLLALLLKFFPATLGAAVMCLFDMPNTKREWFIRGFVAMAASYLFGEAVFDWLDSISWFSFLDTGNRKHHTAVEGLLGAISFLGMNMLATLLKRYRDDPTKVDELIKR